MSFSEIARILGNLSEFIGAIVIVASPIYLAVQVKQNTEHLKIRVPAVRLIRIDFERSSPLQGALRAS